MMTRKEAAKIANTSNLIDTLEALGLIKFDEEKKIECLYQSENDKIWGVIKVVEYNNELSIWISGKHRFTLKKDEL